LGRKRASSHKFKPEGPIEIDPLKDRLQQAVGTDYRVERLLGSGGMGLVYVAHNLRLNLPLAIKVLRPELDTAAGGEGFLREARMLASIRHTNVVVIYDWGEGEGLKYYFMELVGGPTLEQRLRSGPMPADQVVRMGINLLDGLDQVHRLGLVHRDIKPSNVFLLPNRALLADFGIARPSSDDTHNGDGTPEYMAPEQAQRKPITPRTDIYSTGVVLYKAVTGRRFHAQGEHVDWSGIAPELARVLRQAVAPKPDERWADVAAFRAALQRIETPNRIRTLVAIIAGVVFVGAAAGAIVIFIGGRPPPPRPRPPLNPHNASVVFERVDYVGPPQRRPIADSLTAMVQSDLGSHINFVDSAGPGTLPVRMGVTVTGADVGVRLTGGIPAADFVVPLERWPAVREAVNYHIVYGVWVERSPLRSLPRRALPRTSEGLATFLDAERLFAEAEWWHAHEAYEKAVSTDSTCWICLWRQTEVDRWLGREPDPERVRRYRSHSDSLPPPWASLIRAAQLRVAARLDTLHNVTERWRGDFLGWFQLGDELFHRGPLVGHRRVEAVPAFERATRLQPDFAPAWEHLAWAAIAAGDSASAANALVSLETHSVASDAYSLALRALLHVGFAWRFYPDTLAQRLTAIALSAPASQGSSNLGAGPRLLPTFDAPRGAIALGRMLAQQPIRDLQRSGLIAQIFGAVALGRIDTTRSLARQLADVAPEPALDFFFVELRAMLAVLDSAAVSPEDARDGLRLWLLSGDSALRSRAAWMSSVLEQRSRLRSSAPREFHLTVTAELLAAAGQTPAALRLANHIPVDSVARTGDPFLRALVHFRRAEWRAGNGDIEGAKSELIWYEHLDVVGLPTEDPQAAEVDWAFGTLARWRLARLLDRARGAGRRAEGTEACDAYAGVIRNWTGAPAPYGARADTARVRAHALSCARR